MIKINPSSVHGNTTQAWSMFWRQSRLQNNVAADEDVAVCPQLSNINLSAEVAVEKEMLRGDRHDKESEGEGLHATGYWLWKPSRRLTDCSALLCLVLIFLKHSSRIQTVSVCNVARMLLAT